MTDLTNKSLGELPPDQEITFRPHRAGVFRETPRRLMAEGRFKPTATVGYIEFAFSRD
jgi:hypothetical protein